MHSHCTADALAPALALAAAPTPAPPPPPAPAPPPPPPPPPPTTTAPKILCAIERWAGAHGKHRPHDHVGLLFHRSEPPTCPRAGWVSMLLLEWLRNAVQPPGSRTYSRCTGSQGTPGQHSTGSSVCCPCTCPRPGCLVMARCDRDLRLTGKYDRQASHSKIIVKQQTKNNKRNS